MTDAIQHTSFSQRVVAPACQRIIVALDVDNEKQAAELVRELRDEVSFFKVGLELFLSVGPSIVRTIRDAGGDVFLDCKFMDIPATVAGASRAAARLGVRFFNVHCLGGRAMIAAATAAAKEFVGANERPRVLGVTVLTSIDETAMTHDLNIKARIFDQVVHLAKLGIDSGLDGVIASPLEVAALRESLPPSSIIVTPGVRPVWAAGNDQKRVATPADAIRNGADFLVIGRPITRPPQSVGSPKDALRLIVEEITEVSETRK